MNRICFFELIIFVIATFFQNGYGEVILKNQFKSLAPINNEIIIEQSFGSISDNKLSHRFSKFNLLKNDHVIFTGDESIRHIISYIQDDLPSYINGKITCDIENANLFLLNPKGIIFGNNAQIDVSGVFCATTANEVNIHPMGEQEQIHFDNTLLTIDSTVIEFIDTTGPIIMDTLELTHSGSIALIGGEINLHDSRLYPKGDIIIDGISLTLNHSGFVTDQYDHTKMGSVYITVRDRLSLINGSYIHTDTISSIDAGSTTIKAREIIVDHSTIRSMSIISGNSGNISIQALEDIVFKYESNVNTVSIGKHNAGNIHISGRNIFFMESSGLASQTNGKGKGGDIEIEASETLLLGGSAKNNNSSCSFTSYSGIKDILIKDAGDAGNIKIKAKDLILQDGGKIVSGSLSYGKGGDVSIGISNSLLIQGENLNESISSIGFSSGISSFAKQTGNAGIIDINVGKNIRIKNRGEITSSSFARGDAGNIFIQSTQLILENQASISSGSYADHKGGVAGKIDISCNNNIQLLKNSQLSTEAINSISHLNDQDNGSIHVWAQNLIQLQQSAINTSVHSGSGDGGNIYSNSSQMALNHSEIIADAYEGTGGNIFIVAEHFFKSSDSIIQADSQLGMSGNIYIHAPDINVGKDLFGISDMFMDASNLLITACDKRSGDSISKLTWSGKNGISFHPEDWIPGNFQFSNKINQVGTLEIKKGESAFLNGYYEQSINHFQNALLFIKDSIINTSSKNHFYVETMIGIAISFMRMGFYKNADMILSDLYTRIQNNRTAYLEAIYFTTLCDLSLAMGNSRFNDYLTDHLKKLNPDKKYITDYSKSKYLIKCAIKTQNPFIKAMVLNQMGTYLAIHRDYNKAISLYSKSLEMLSNTKKSKANAQLTIKIQINRLNALMMNNDANKDELYQYTKECSQDIDLLLNEIYPLDLISFSMILWKLKKQYKKNKLYLKYLIYLSYARDKAISLKNNYITSQVFYMMGQIYEAEGQVHESLKAIRKAIFHANLVDADESLVFCYQQLGHTYNKIGKTNLAFDSYKKAINLINPLIQTCSSCNEDETRPPGIIHYFFSGYRDDPHNYFNLTIKPLFKEYIELLSLNNSQQNVKNEQEELKKMRNVIEAWISSEIQNYFKDECLMAFQKEMLTLDNGLHETAIIHPIILKNKLDILITLPDRIVRESNTVTYEELTFLIKQFRNSVEIDKMELKIAKLKDYNPDSANQLYDIIIHPCLKHFKNYNIQTLVIVPTDELRNIPFSALYDGSQFLVEQYAVVNISALLITDMKKQDQMPQDIFLGGITKELPMVKPELYTIRDIMGNGKIMIDKDFSRNRIINEFKHNFYSIVVLSSHAQFDNLLENTFIQTYDDKLYMDDLERMIRFGMLRKNRTELLVLDACQTSKGNDQSSLGFSGIALKSGAKSVIGSLWSVLDEFSYLFMVDFFKGMKSKYENKMLTKAQIFQSIQKKYIHRSKYNHPAYWSAFIILGNWL